MAGPGRPGPECSVGQMLDRMASTSPEDHEIATMVLEDWGYEHTLLTEVFQEYGFDLSLGQVKHHRQGHCRCHDEDTT